MLILYKVFGNRTGGHQMVQETEKKEPGERKAKVLYNQINSSPTHCSHMCFSSQEAKKKDEMLLKFPERLQDVQSAAR